MKHVEILLSNGQVIVRDCETWKIDDDDDIQLHFPGKRQMFVNERCWVSVEGDE